MSIISITARTLFGAPPPKLFGQQMTQGCISPPTYTLRRGRWDFKIVRVSGRYKAEVTYLHREIDWNVVDDAVTASRWIESWGRHNAKVLNNFASEEKPNV